MTLKYREIGLNRSAQIIAGEIILQGKSSGWVGTIKEREEVAKYLAPLNIVYSDDFTGTWKLKKQ